MVHQELSQKSVLLFHKSIEILFLRMLSNAFFFSFSSGLNILYPGEAEINNLLKLVLTEGENL